MTEPTTLHELTVRRRAADRPTHVHVVGDFDRLGDDLPKGLATAKRVAHLLVDEEGTVLEEDYGDLDDGDVAFVRIDEPPTSQDSYEARQELHTLTAMSRVKMLAGIVVFTERVSARAEQHLDARVWAESGGVDRVDRLQIDAYNDTVYATELEGLHA
jgi:hypothetical protein